MISVVKKNKTNGQSGFGIPEALIVLMVAAILLVIALPHYNASRRHTRFAELRKQVAASLNEARRTALAQREPITFRYDDLTKQIVIYGGALGALGDTKNKVRDLAEAGLNASEIVYGLPDGAPANIALADTSNIIALSGTALEMTFQPDGKLTDAAANPINNALFFFNSKNPQTTAFAVSTLGTDGAVKFWQYNKNIKLYTQTN